MREPVLRKMQTDDVKSSRRCDAILACVVFLKWSPKMGRSHAEQCLLGTLLRFIVVDVAGPLPETESARQYLLVAMDFFRK